jgi:CDP-diacylglycerol--serine O-phosphatidyltransferase
MSFDSLQIPARGWIPAAVTAANICLGFLAMLQSATGRFETAVYLLVVAIVLDVVDGRLARWLRATSDFGKQIDSFCDVLSFGAAPAFLVYLAVLRPLGPAGLAAALLFLLAAVYRLARFAMLADPHAKARRTLGVPTPIGAGYLMALALMRDRLPALGGAAIVVGLAMLMASRWRLPDLKGTNLVTGMLVVGIGNYLAVVAWPNWYTVGWWNLWNLLILLAARWEDRRVAFEGPP